MIDEFQNILEKIPKPHFIGFIQDSFMQTGKSIQTSLCEKLIDLVDEHPYFIQQLAHVLWVNTDFEATENILDNSINDVLAQNSILYQEIINSLSGNQLSFLIALAKGLKT